MPSQFSQRGYATPNFGGGIAGILATPARIEASQQQAAIDRALLGRMGMSPADQRMLVPEPPLSLPGGIAGKALSGLGTVGSILSTVLGAPIPAPRASLGQILAIEQMRPGMERRKILGATAARIGAAEDLQDEELIKGMVADFLRVGDSSSALALIKQQNKGREATLKGALSRMAIRTAGAPAGTPRGDQAIAQMFAGYEGLKETMRINANLAGPVAARQAEVKSLEAAAVTTGTTLARLSATNKDNFAKLRTILPMARAAVNRRLKSSSWSGSMVQGGKLWTASKSQDFARQVFRMDVDQQMIDDIQVIQDLRAFAGAFIKGADLDKGKLSDKDIERAMPSLPDIYDTQMQATAALNIWEQIVNEISQMDLQTDLDEQLAPIVQRLIGFAEETEKKGSQASGLTGDMVDDFKTPEEGVTGGPESQRMQRALELIEKKYGSQQ